MHIFYNETFGIRIVVNAQDEDTAVKRLQEYLDDEREVEKLREYYNNRQFNKYRLTAADFKIEPVDVQLG